MTFAKFRLRLDRKRCVVAGLALVAAAIALGGHCYVQRQLSALRATEAQWARLRAQSTPVLRPEVLSAVEGELLELQRRESELRQALVAPREVAVPGRDVAGAEPLQAFLAVARFVETCRADAGREGIRLLPRERFGFERWATAAPAAMETEPLRRDLAIAALLWADVVAVRPKALLAMKRTGRGPTSPKSAPETGSGFQVPASLSLAGDGVIDTLAWQVEFTGDTRVLRDLLRRLAASPVPVAVRRLQVGAAPAVSAESRKSGSLQMITGARLRKFTMSIEYLLVREPLLRST